MRDSARDGPISHAGAPTVPGYVRRVHPIRLLNELDNRVLGPARHRPSKTSTAIGVLLWTAATVVGAIVALLGDLRYGWSLCALGVFCEGFQGLHYLSLRYDDDEDEWYSGREGPIQLVRSDLVK